MSTQYVFQNKTNHFILDQTCDRKKESIVLIFNTPNAFHNNIHPKDGDKGIISQLSQSFPVYYYNNIQCLDDIIRYLQLLINCNKKIAHLIIQAHGDPQGIVFGIEYSIHQFRSLDKTKVIEWFTTWVQDHKIDIEKKQLEELTVFFDQEEVDGDVFLNINQQNSKNEPILKKYETIITRAIQYLQISTQYVHLDDTKDQKDYFMRAIPSLKQLLLPNSSIFIHACNAGRGGSFSDNFCNRLSLSLPHIEIYGAESNISVGDVYAEQIIHSTLFDNGIKMIYDTDQYPIYTFYSIQNIVVQHYRFIQGIYAKEKKNIINVIDTHDSSTVLTCSISKSISLLHESKYIQTFVLDKVSETKQSIPPLIIQEIVNMFNTTKTLFVITKKDMNDLFSPFVYQECDPFLQLKSRDTHKLNLYSVHDFTDTTYSKLFCERIKHVIDRLKSIKYTLESVMSIIHKIEEKKEEHTYVLQFFLSIKTYIEEYSSFLIDCDHLRYINIQVFNQFFYNYTYRKLARIIHLDHYKEKMADDIILLNLKILVSQINEFDIINDHIIQQIYNIINTGQCLELVIDDLIVRFGNQEKLDYNSRQNIDLFLGNFIKHVKKELCKKSLLLSQTVMRLPNHIQPNPFVFIRYEKTELTKILQYPYIVQNLKIFLIDHFTPEFIIERLNDYKIMNQMFGEKPNQNRLTIPYVKQFLQNYDIFKSNISDISTDFCIQNSKEWNTLKLKDKHYLFEYNHISEKDLDNIKSLVDEKSSEKIQILSEYVNNHINNIFFLDKGLFADKISYVYKTDISDNIGTLYKPKKKNILYMILILKKGFVYKM